MKLKAFGLITILLLLGSISLVTPVMADSLEIINNISPFNSPYGLISVNATVAKSDYSTLPVYHGTYTDNGSLNIQLQQIGKKRQNVPTEQEAPTMAQHALESYGGLPQDAVLDGASTSYSEYYVNGTLDHKEPIFTTVSYSINMDGLWIIGESNSIIITLGENGEPLWIFKEWRTYTQNGDVKIIPVTTAFKKLRQGDIISGAMVENDNITIDIASLGYYAKTTGNSDTDLEPVWMLFGPSSSGSRIGFYIYARQFANFTSTPASGTVPLTVSFTDTSDASPVKWYWDFGDGTNSTEQSPKHMYTTDGIYNVSLRAWNDLGSDTIVKTNCVKAGMLNPPIANFTATPLSGKVPLTVMFNDTSVGGEPTLWYWTFGDGSDAAGPDVVHTYTAPGNYTVVLEVANADGDVFETRPDYITVTPLTPPVVDFSADITSGKAPLVVHFTDISTNAPTAWEWSFGDGYVSTEQNPAHQYDVSGNYSVSLNATNADGSSVLSKPAFITVIKPDNANDLINQLIVYIRNQNNVPRFFQNFLIGELTDVKFALKHNHPDNAVMGMKFFKITVDLFTGWPLTKDQASTMQNSADAIIRAINLPVNQQAIDSTKQLSADVKSLNLPSSVQRPLILKLEGTLFALECSKDSTARIYLDSFISSVRAQDGKKIPHDKAVQLIAKAEAIKATIKP